MCIAIRYWHHSGQPDFNPKIYDTRMIIKLAFSNKSRKNQNLRSRSFKLNSGCKPPPQRRAKGTETDSAMHPCTAIHDV